MRVYCSMLGRLDAWMQRPEQSETSGRRDMTNWRTVAVATTAVCGLLAASVFTAGPTFRADYRFTGNALTGFKPAGQADWKVQNGEIVGTPKDAGGGWLLLDGK